MEVEVYSDADEVELHLNGQVVGRAPAGPEHHFRCRFDVAYVPGTLTAIAYVHGEERSRTVLSSAGEPVLMADVDRRYLRADHADLAFVTVELRDDAGNLASAVDRVVSVEVTGAATLQAFGSARPVTDERYDSVRCTTFDGRALAIVRPTRTGAITVTVQSEGLQPVTLELEASHPQPMAG